MISIHSTAKKRKGGRYQERISQLVKEKRDIERAAGILAAELKHFNDFRTALDQLRALLDRPDALRALANASQYKTAREAEAVLLRYVESSGSLQNGIWDKLIALAPVNRDAVQELVYTGVGEPGY